SRRASFDAAYHRVGETSGSNRGAVEKDLNRCAGLNHKIGTAITVEVGCVDSAVIGYADFLRVAVGSIGMAEKNAKVRHRARRRPVAIVVVIYSRNHNIFDAIAIDVGSKPSG